MMRTMLLRLDHVSWEMKMSFVLSSTLMMAEQRVARKKRESSYHVEGSYITQGGMLG